MENVPKFTLAWKVAVVVALLAAFSRHDTGDSQTEREMEAANRRLVELEQRIAKIETYLYQNPPRK